MRVSPVRTREVLLDDTYFERKARELIVADDEIEAWEFDRRDLDSLGDFADTDFEPPALD